MAEGMGVPTVQATFLPSCTAIAQSVGKIMFGQIAVWFRGSKCVYFCQVRIEYHRFSTVVSVQRIEL